LILGACQQAPTESPRATEEAKQEDVVPTEAEAEAEAEKDRTPGEVVADGVFLGRSGKPMANARLVLGEVVGDQEVTYARVKLVGNVSTAVADREGRFQFKGFTPDTYTIVYQPSGVSDVLPIQINIKPFLAADKSITPLLRGVELGKNEPYAARAWGRRFTLLKGHTFYSQGPIMKIWNATVRQGRGGPYMEIRRGVLWTDRFEDGSEIKLEAWSY
jgi:hypothetical protein